MMARSLLFVLLSFFTLAPGKAQQWELTTPIKDRSEITGLVLLDQYNGFATDQVLRCVLATTDGGYTWERRITLPDAPRDVWMWDGQRGIVCTEGLHFYSTTDGFAHVTSVEELTTDMQQLFFADELVGYAVGDAGKIQKTIDGGADWTTQVSGVPNNLFNVQFLDAQEGFLAGGYVLLHTTDGGTNWTPLTLPQDAYVHDVHFDDPLHGIAVGYGGLIIRTADGGVNWTVVPSPNDGYFLDIEVEGDVLIASGEHGVMIRSADGGDTWNEVGGVGLNDHNCTDINATGAGLSGTNGDMYRTTDLGATWALVQDGTAHTVLNKVSFANDTLGVCVGNTAPGGFGNGFLRTTDSGRHWTDLGGGGIGVHLRPDGVGVAGAVHTSDFFTTTQASIHAPEMAIRAVWAFTPSRYIVAGGYVNGGIYYTENGGSTWTHPVSVGLSIFDLYFPTDLVGFACGEGGILYRTIDGGANWTELVSPSNADLYSVFFLDELHGWIPGARTVDGGATWENTTLSSSVRSILFADPDTGYAVSYNSLVLRSVDGGATWATFMNDYPNAQIGDAALVDGALVAVGRFGDMYRAQLNCSSVAVAGPVIAHMGDQLYSSAPEGNQWYLNGSPIDGATGASLTPSVPGTYHVVTTDALGCSSRPSNTIDLLTTGVADHGPVQDPRIVPNPAKDRFSLDGTVPAGGRVDVLDPQGRLVHTTTVNGSSASIEIGALPAGVYLVRCVLDGAPWTGRLVKE